MPNIKTDDDEQMYQMLQDLWDRRAESVDDVFEHINGMRSEQSQPVPEWQPIETAPKDGTVVLAWRFYAVAIKWNPHAEGEFLWDAVQLGGHVPMLDNGFKDGDPLLTHWMPLPAAPKPGGES